LRINKLDLLGRGWKASEIEQASQIIAEAENKKQPDIKLIDKLLIGAFIILLLANSFVCAIALMPFLYAIQTSFIMVIVGIIGLIFGILITMIIHDIEKIHHARETGLFLMFIAGGIINAYFIVEFSRQFGIRTGLALTNNVWLVAATYLIAFLIPQVIYQQK